MPLLNIQDSLNDNNQPSPSVTGGQVAVAGPAPLNPVQIQTVNNGTTIIVPSAINIETEAASISGSTNSSSLIPDRIDLSGIDLSITGGVVPSVVIDNIYNSSFIQNWNYAYDHVIKTVEISPLGGDLYRVRLIYLNDTYIENTFTVRQDKNYVHEQQVSSSTWVITHNLAKFASVGIVDTAGDEVEGEVRHNSINQVTITFSVPVSGKAYIN
jgi:hypothetical protein